MVELADCLQTLLQLLIVIQPAAEFRDLLRPQAVLPGASAARADGINRERVATAADADRAAGAIPVRATNRAGSHRRREAGRPSSAMRLSLDDRLGSGILRWKIAGSMSDLSGVERIMW